jgi:hypothetical protein
MNTSPMISAMKLNLCPYSCHLSKIVLNSRFNNLWSPYQSQHLGKHHTPSAAVGKPPAKGVENDNQKDPTSSIPENGQHSSLDVGIAASKVTVVHNYDGTLSVISKDITHEANSATDVASEQVNTSKKSVFLSKMFSKPPI